MWGQWNPQTFWNIIFAHRENMFKLFFCLKDIYCIFCNYLLTGPSDISKRKIFTQALLFELLRCRKLCLMLSSWFLLLGRLPSIVYRNTDKENVKKKKILWHLFCNCTESGLLLKSDSFFLVTRRVLWGSAWCDV